MLFCSGRLIIAAIGFCAASARSCVDCWARAAVLAVSASMTASPKVGQKAEPGISAFACRPARELQRSTCAELRNSLDKTTRAPLRSTRGPAFPREHKGMQFAFTDYLANLPEREEWNQ